MDNGSKAEEAAVSLADAVNDYTAGAQAEATKRAAVSDMKVFTAWCVAHKAVALPALPTTVAAFIADQARGISGAKKSLATVVRYMASIGKTHKLSGYVSPTSDANVRKVLEGIRREKGTRSPNRKDAMTPECIAAAVEADDDGSLRHLRDKALVLFGLASAMRRSEIVALNVQDLEWVDGGVNVYIGWSKTDQTGEGRRVGVPELHNASICPVRALQKWLDAASIKDGPVFRGLTRSQKVKPLHLSDQCVAIATKRFAAAAGIDPDAVGAHSLRSGYVTLARGQGQDWTTIMEQTGHKGLAMVKRYDQSTRDPLKASRAAEALSGAFKVKRKKP